MAPLTRSSAPSTPAKTRPDIGQLTPTRRTPHCTKCHRPRAGHPRSGCPFVDASDPTSPASPLSTQSTQLADDGLLEDLSSLKIVSPTEENARTPKTTLKRKLSVRFALVPEQTLASLSTTDTQLVEQLLQPGMISDVVSPQDKVAHVLRWQKTLGDADPVDSNDRMEDPVKVEDVPPPSSSNNLAPPPLSRRMPCTLFTPTASLATVATDPGPALDMPDANTDKPKPLIRSMSLEQRSSFIQQLSHSSRTAPATLLSLPLADLDNVRSDAEGFGFHVRVLPSKDENNKWVILGTDDEAVALLAEKFLKEEKKRGARVEGRSGKLTAVAGGVVFGAVATWTGLAFS